MTAEEVINHVNGVLDKIIDGNVKAFRRDDSFKVRPGYGYDKFYLDWVDGSYDMSLQSLVHYILYEDGIYKKILTKKQFAAAKRVVEEQPECIYGAQNEETGDFDQIQYDVLDPVFWDTVKHVGKRLIELGFDVKETFADYLQDE